MSKSSVVKYFPLLEYLKTKLGECQRQKCNLKHSNCALTTAPLSLKVRQTREACFPTKLFDQKVQKCGLGHTPIKDKNFTA